MKFNLFELIHCLIYEFSVFIREELEILSNILVIDIKDSRLLMSGETIESLFECILIFFEPNIVSRELFYSFHLLFAISCPERPFFKHIALEIQFLTVTVFFLHI